MKFIPVVMNQFFVQTRLIFLSAFGVVMAVAAETTPAGPNTLKPSPVPASYPIEAFSALGASVAQSSHFAELGWTDAQISAFVDGFRGAFHGSRPLETEDMRRLMGDIAKKINDLEAREKEQKFAQPGAVDQYMKEIRKQHELQQADSGLCYNIQSGGTGVRPDVGDTVVVTINCLSADGKTKLPQLSVEQQRIKMADLTPGLLEGFQMTTVGSKAVFVVPPALSYGDGEWPQGVDRGSPLIYLVFLHEVVSAASPP